MISLTAIGLNHSRLTALVTILVLGLATLVYLNFPKREDPETIMRTAVISAANTGLTINQLEELVARPIEDVARAVEGVDEVRTQLTGGRAIIHVDIEDEVPSDELKRVFDEIRDDIEAMANSMPDGTRGPNVNTSFGDTAIATVAITGEGFSPAEMEDLAEELRDRFYTIEDISAVHLDGVQEERIWLEIDRTRLASIGTTLTPVIAALQAQNVRLPAGSVVVGGTRLPLETTGDYESVEDIENTLVELPDVGLVRLADVLDVRRGYQTEEELVYFNGEPAVLVSVEMHSGSDIIVVGRELTAIVDQFQSEQPAGVEVSFSTYQPDVVDESVNNAQINMVQTFVVVFLTMLVFLGWREAVVIASIVPLAMSFAFIGMDFMGIELHQISIAAIIISLGLLVDNGLVMVEDIERRISEGIPRKEAALQAGRQYTVPLLIASTTTVAAFVPLFILDGTEGEYAFSLGMVVALMLTGSFLSAFYILPTFAYWLLPDPKPDHKPSPFDRLAEGYGALIRLVVRAPIVVIGITFAIVALGLMQFGGVTQQLFPSSDREQFLVYVDMPKGTDISQTDEVALRITNWLSDETINPEVTDTTTFVGFGGPRFVLSLDPADEEPSSAFMVVNTADFAGTLAARARLQQYAAAEVPEANVRVKLLAMGGREPAVDIQISGPDPDVLLQAAYVVEEGFSNAPGIVENRNNWGSKQIIGRVAVAQDQAREYGLTSKDISDALAAFFDGSQVSTYRQDDTQIPIMVIGAEGFRDGLENLANAAIEANGQILAIDQFARLEAELEFSTIRRVDQRPRITVTAISDAVSAYELVDHIRPTLDALDLGPAYSVTVAGEVDQAAEVQQTLGAGLPYAFAIMLLALMTQFNSFRRVTLIFLTVPLILVGSPLILIIFDQPLSFFGMLGLIVLTGIIINNAIVLIDQIDIERETLGINDAIVAAAKKRLRPILLTSLTTVLGLTPMALAGGNMFEPMATLMIGGLSVAAVMALFFVPAMYRLFFRDSKETATDTQAAQPAE